MSIQDISLADYHYELPEERIAQYPLAQRDESKLLTYRDGKIDHRHFFDLPGIIPEKSLLVFNDARVIPARIFLQRKTGARIEVFLLNPHTPSEVQQSMQAKGTCVWHCLIGKKKRWKEGEVLEKEWIEDGITYQIQVSWFDREKDYVKLEWEPEDLSFAELVEKIGNLPLPPYVEREVEEVDYEQYQTVYAKQAGAVAAPTAGLHFTDRVLVNLSNKGISSTYVTLHVSAGTFLPVQEDKVVNHPMHEEQISLSKEHLQTLIKHLGSTIPVGTTSMRLIESFFWLGVMAGENPEMLNQPLPLVEKLIPYTFKDREFDKKQVLETLWETMDKKHLNFIRARTEIMILPGYQFQLSNGLITNFHMPGTTLILLVAALIGEDWREVYQQALTHEYRFLSYGDSSLLLPG
ncbi:MAG: S-adenosylmethionine:tRNA ribosyltransferase-isomerase [Bacteroidota bacterium]